MPAEQELRKAHPSDRFGEFLSSAAESDTTALDQLRRPSLFAPAKTPREIAGKISADTNIVLAEPAIRAKLAEMGYVAAGSSPEELGKLLRSEIARWSALIKSVGIRLD